MVGDTLFSGVAALLVIPLVGLLLLIFGIRRYRSKQRSGPPVYWSPPALPPGWYPPPAAPMPPPQRPQKLGGSIAMIVVGSLFVVVGSGLTVVAAWGAADSSTEAAQRSSAPSASPDGLRIGQCITDRQYASAEMSPEPTDCAGRDAVYELAYQGEGPAATCPDGLREDSGYAVLFNSSHTFCFVLNVREGECFSVDAQAQLFSPVDCSDPAATSKIDRIIDGTEDLSLCPAGPQGAAFPVPARTYCVIPPQ